MSQRGRGCFEIRPPTSAFYRTSTSEIGDEIIRTTDIVDISESSERQAASTATQSFSFLYTRESDKIGSKVRNDAIDNNPHFSAVACQRRQNRARNMIDENETCETIKIPELTTEQVLATYKQGSKVEDPRFTTSANDYGKKAPTIATYVAERSSTSQEFTRSFQNMNHKNTGLNTSMTKSHVHSKLDPQFN